VTHFEVPNNVIFQNLRADQWVDADNVGDELNHGTAVAAIAGGSVHGVAPNADLHLIKFVGKSTAMGEAAETTNNGALIQAISNAFNKIIEVQRQGKRAVINLSVCKLCSAA
jgi:subtilisin family serine protease